MLSVGFLKLNLVISPIIILLLSLFIQLLFGVTPSAAQGSLLAGLIRTIYSVQELTAVRYMQDRLDCLSSLLHNYNAAKNIDRCSVVYFVDLLF